MNELGGALEYTPTTSGNHSLYAFSQVTKVYGSRQVIAVDGLSIRPGEIFALVGPSGSGKSTLLRLMNFLEAPTQGEIVFQGMPFSSEKVVPLNVRRRVTMVFQRPMLLNRSVAGNVRFGLELRGHRAADELVHSVLDEVGLRDLANNKATRLSGGEAQRVALARAMVLQPEVLLLDEPTANLDPYNVGLIERIIRTMNRAHQTTLVLVTHNVFQAKRLADRVAFLLDGRIVEVAENKTFFQSPSDPRTAAFVRGDMVY